MRKHKKIKNRRWKKYRVKRKSLKKYRVKYLRIKIRFSPAFVAGSAQKDSQIYTRVNNKSRKQLWLGEYAVFDRISKGPSPVSYYSTIKTKHQKH